MTATTLTVPYSIYQRVEPRSVEIIYGNVYQIMEKLPPAAHWKNRRMKIYKIKAVLIQNQDEIES